MTKQEFTIKQNAELPLLVMKLNKETNFLYQEFHEKLPSALITFSMKDVNTGQYKITNKKGSLITKQGSPRIVESPEYYIYFKFGKKDTNKAGRYIGEFKVKFPEASGLLQGSFIAPISSTLYINITPSMFK